MFTAVPSEILIVDRPAVPSAKFFEIHKRDGSTVQREFKNYGSVGVDRASVMAVRKAQRSPRPVQLAGGIQVLVKGATHNPRRLEKAVAANFAGDGAADSVNLIKMVQRAGSRPYFGKAMPQSANAACGGRIASTGATNNFRDQSWNPTKPTTANAPHSASVRSTGAGPTQKSMMADALKAIHKDLARAPGKMRPDEDEVRGRHPFMRRHT